MRDQPRPGPAPPGGSAPASGPTAPAWGPTAPVTGGPVAGVAFWLPAGGFGPAAGRRAADGLTGSRYLLAILVLVVLSTLPMLAAIGGGMAALEPSPEGTTSVRPFLTPPAERPVVAPAPPIDRPGVSADRLSP